MSPELQPDVSLIEVALYSVLNPALIVVAFYLGRLTNEPQKLILAAFGGAIAGVALLYCAAWLGISDAPALGRAAAGIFAASLVAGVFYAWLGRKFMSTRR